MFSHLTRTTTSLYGTRRGECARAWTGSPTRHRRHQPAVTHGALAQVRGFDLAVEQVDVFAGLHDGELVRAHPLHLPGHLRGFALFGVSQRLRAAPHLVLVVVPSAGFAYAAAEATEESAEEAREVHAEAREEVHSDGVVHQDERHQDASPAAKGVLLLTFTRDALKTCLSRETCAGFTKKNICLF